MEIQRCVRGFSTRLFVGRSGQRSPAACRNVVKARKERIDARPPKAAKAAQTSITTLPGSLEMRETDLGLVARYLEAKVRNQLDGDAGFQLWALNRLQGWARMVPVAQYWKTMRWSIFHKAAASIQRGWSVSTEQRVNRGEKLNPAVSAAFRIQHCWQAFTNRRIFGYFRDMIQFREQGKCCTLGEWE